MQINNKKIITIIKLFIICMILILLSGVGVKVIATRLNPVKIILSNGYEITVLTSKTNIEDILQENNIVLSSKEKVLPDLTEKLPETKVIRILDKNEKEIEIANVNESKIEMTLENLLNSYSSITEKIETVEESIPYETITKDISDGAQSTKNKIVQEGEDGIKKVTYKVKYQNEVELEKNKISEEVIKEPVNKIIQIKSNITITNRSSESSRSSRINTNLDDYEESNDNTTSLGVYKVTAYCPCSKCCGSWQNGITAWGTTARAGRTIAAPSNFPFGTKLKINGKTYTVEDRGGAIKGNRIDLYVNSHSEAMAWGVKYLNVERVN